MNKIKQIKFIAVNIFTAERDCSRIYRSLPNARLQSKFKGSIFNCYKGRKSLFFISKCSGDIIISYMEVYAIFCTRNVYNVIRFRGNKKYRTHVRGDDIHDALSPLIVLLLFISDETTYHNKS